MKFFVSQSILITIFTFQILLILSCDDSINSQEPINEDVTFNYYYPVAKAEQLQWQEDKLAMFIHFGINTFTNKELGDGTENPQIFNPIDLDVNQWVKTAKSAGFKLIILTAKHVDGFCLWPSNYTEYTIKNSPWKNGDGDVVKELSQACKSAGIKFGFYLAPWDKHEPTYGTDEYDDYFVHQLEELLTNYGEITEVWFDGAGPAGHLELYDWSRYFDKVKELQPHALIAIIGPDIRWIGNESGLGEETEWCSREPWSLVHGNATDNVWYPSESDVSIRPGWFWHPEEDNQVKSTEKLLDIYFKSVGRNSNLLLNVPPNKDGKISDYDVNRLINWKSKLSEIFNNDLALGKNVLSSNIRGNALRFDPNNCTDGNPDSFWATDDNIISCWLIIDLVTEQKFNVIKLEEPIQFGQRISSYKVEAFISGSWLEISNGTTVGRTKIDLLNKSVTTNKVRVSIEGALSNPALRTIALYKNE
ncbi:MAG: alpha-L-fucosidase [Bacteroidetes bacterium]|nr:alpha-L-fucosidase [Bacteroidota bacterium]